MRTRSLKIILIVAAAIRLTLLASVWNAPDRLLTPDSHGYLELSDNLAREASFHRDARPEIFRTPGYPLFLVPVILFEDAGWRLVALGQIFLDVLLVYLTFLLGVLLCDERVGLWAAAFQSVAVVSAVASVRVLSDGLFAFLLILSILLLVHHFKTSKWWSLLSAAALTAVSCYVRPVGLMFSVLALAVLLLRTKRFRRSAAFAGIVLLAISPWIVRNCVVADYVGFSSFAGDSLYYFGVSEVHAELEQKDPETVRSQMRSAQERLSRTFGPERTPGAGARDRRSQALSLIRQHPWIYARTHLRGSAAFFLPAISDVLEIIGLTAGQRGTLDVLHREGIWAAIRHYLDGRTWLLLLCIPAGMILLIKYALVALCAAARVRFRMGPGGWLIFITIIAFALIGGAAATSRFRVPVAPLLSLAAAAGIVLPLNLAKQRGQSVSDSR